jgi:acyl-coenzyme A thioesterase PaaI-like protein
MTQSNRLSKLVKATSKFPKGIRSTIWSKAFGRIVPMVGTANIRYLEVDQDHVVVRIENQRNMQNHIKGVHAAAMALLAETATGFLTGLHVPDNRILLIKTLHVDYLKVAQGGLTATASLSPEQQKLIAEQEKGELLIPVTVIDDAGNEPIQCQMLWAWLPKRKSDQ